MIKKLPPMHPGEVLREEFLAPLALSALSVARACGVPRTRIERLAREETGVTGDTAVRLSAYFGTTPDFWMNLQGSYEIETAKASASAALGKIRPRAGVAA